MNHCKENQWDGTEVIDGRLEYSASLSEASCFTLLWLSSNLFPGRRLQIMHQPSIIHEGKESSTIFIDQKLQSTPGKMKIQRIQYIATHPFYLKVSPMG